MNKFVFLIHSLHTGGMERVMVELANNFSRRDDTQVHIVLYGINPEIFYHLDGKVMLHLPKSVLNGANRLYGIFSRMRFIREKVKEIGPSSILSFGEYWNSFVLLSLLDSKIPIFVSDRCQPNKSLGFLHNQLRRLLYPLAKGIIAQTNIAKKIYEQKKLNRRIVVIGNPIRKIDLANSKREKVVLTVGRLIESKHHDVLIRIFSRINLIGWKLFIIGDDAIKQKNFEKLKDLINSLSLQEKVYLLGKRADVDHYYKTASVFAFTSSSEGFPNVVGEAMSAALPTVVYDCIAGPSDLIIDGETGFLIPLHNELLFESRLKQLMESEDLRMKMGLKGAKSVKMFSVDAVSDKFHELMVNN